MKSIGNIESTKEYQLIDLANPSHKMFQEEW